MAVPLIAAVVTAVVQVDRLAQRNRVAVLDAENATHESRALIEFLTTMERSLGQYGVFRDRDFYLTYQDARREFQSAAQRLGALNLNAILRRQLAELVQAEAQLNQAVLTSSGDPIEATSPQQIADEWAALNARSRSILAESSKLIASHASRAKDMSTDLQRTLLLQAAAAVPVAVLLAVVFVVLITRPLRQIESEIRRLGSGEFAASVSVRGPRDLEELGSRLDWLRRRILELEEQKTTFLRHISHELKTPLTTLREGSELLLDDEARELNAEQREIAYIMRDSGVQLQRLIEDLLEFGRTQVPRVEAPQRAEVALDQVVRSALEGQSLVKTAKALTIDARLAPTTLKGDQGQLRILVDNLLSNAVKYTPAHGRIMVSLAADDTDVTLEVADNGPGIDPDERTRVFEPFYQGRAPYQGHVQGTGLGLAIARQYAEAHDGSIDIADSPLGQGACVRVRFRLPRAA
ncbi:MAG TPA: HAMP domain-containing sensor histidine kinase [Steroidobacteraceae bacterium]|nr:HAMP domain-containing sensor histidine kinase [Steroidobacteraceae bacterium]